MIALTHSQNKRIESQQELVRYGRNRNSSSFDLLTFLSEHRGDKFELVERILRFELDDDDISLSCPESTSVAVRKLDTWSPTKPADQRVKTVLQEFLYSDNSVLSLLRCSDEDKSALEELADDHAGLLSSPLSHKKPKFIDRYKLIKEIGIGGMGVVWQAEQIRPVKRMVAVKIIGVGRDTSDTLARFDVERQALALMSHPNIARVLDAGATECNDPFFVMEYVAGVPITDYCDKYKLSVEDRLQLLVDVCDAVQHAHQKGVVHRDLKPSNILVENKNGRAIAKIIDFGLAKALNFSQRLTDRSLHTESGQLLGTIGYMSPEQVESPCNVDPQTDVYSLGVILYKLLAGKAPCENVNQENIVQVLSKILEQEPQPPSEYLSSSTDEERSEICERRGSSPLQLRRILKEELDWVVMKALAKERVRRYATPTGFAEDLKRYLDGKPVQACPPSGAYKLKKFVKNNKGAVASLATILILLIAGIGGTAWGMHLALANKKMAIQYAEETEKHMNIAVESLKRSEDIIGIIRRSFADISPEEEGVVNMSAKEVLFNARQLIEDSGLDDTGKTELLEALGDSFWNLGEYKAAVETFGRIKNE